MSGWPSVSLGDLIRLERRPVEVIADHEYQEIGTFSYGRGIFHKRPRSGLEVGDKDLFLMKEGDLILQITFAWEGAIALCSKKEEGLYGSVRFPTYRVSEERCFAPFLVKYLCTWHGLEQINRICPGSAGRNRVLALKRLPEIQVPLPPLEQQRRIVERIEELKAKIEEAQTLKRKAMDERKALSASVLSSLLPQNAPVKALGDLIAKGSSISYGVLVPGPDVEEGVPFVRVQDLNLVNPPERPNKRISPEVERSYARTRLTGGEILIGVVGSIGKLGIVPPSWAGANIARAVCRIAPGHEINVKYLTYFLSDRATQTYFAEVTRTLAQPTLNVGQLQRTPIRVPPLSVQEAIVAELDALQVTLGAVRMLQEETASELDAMLPAILDRAFKGEL
jgi:type I restriction enzyme, S subunit